MKLSRLYSNNPTVFPAISFNDGLNVVLAEIRDPENIDKDTHNLGKTTLAHVIDFCLLKKKNKTLFLIKHKDIFDEFIFFLELKLGDDRFMTIRRSVAEASKISLLYTSNQIDDANDLSREGWDHWRLPFERSKEIVEGQLNFGVVKGWLFRKPLGYALRLQNDYNDVFQLTKFQGKHGDWKPFLAEFVGLDGGLVQESYNLVAEAEAIKQSIKEIMPNLVGLSSSRDRLEGMYLLRTKEVEDLEQWINNFDFELPDKDLSEELVNSLEFQIATHNERRYNLQVSRKMIDAAMDETIKFDLDHVERVFRDAGVYFGGQLKHDYDDLLVFLASISQERTEFLQQERADIVEELAEIDVGLEQLNKRRVEALATLRDADTIKKYRKYTESLVKLKANLALLEKQREQMDLLVELQHNLSDVNQRRTEILQDIEEHITSSARQESRYREIRLDFGNIVKAVFDRMAVLSCALNNEGNIEFQAEVLDESGITTSADDGYTYRKLLCVAFDLAVFSAYLDDSFIHFVFHDGIFESLDDRKKRCLLDVLRAREDAGLQQIITVIDSDLPIQEDGTRMTFADHEIIRLLHDEGEDGRLFRMQTW